MSNRITITCLVAWVAVASFAMAAEDYEVRVHRPVEVGHRERVSGRLVIQEKATLLEGADERELSDRATEVSFAIDWKVLETSKHGTALKMQGTVIKLDKIGEGVDTVLLDEGTVFTAEIKDGQKVFTTENGAVSQEASRALMQITWIDVKEGVSPESVMGTKDRQKVGGRWDYDSAVAVKGMAGFGWEAKAEEFKGVCKLEGVKEVRGVQCLDVSYQATVGKMKAIVKKDHPNGMRSCEGTTKMSTRVLLPVNSKRFAVSSTREEDGVMTMEFVNPEGGVVRMRVEMKVRVEKSIEPIK